MCVLCSLLLVHASCQDAPTGTLYGEWDRPIVVLALGLESKSDAPFTKRIALAYARRGYDVCVCNYRSCAGGNDIPRKPGGYHLGFTQVGGHFYVLAVRE